jgi:hypothetical protein
VRASLFAKRALALAVGYADGCGRQTIGAEHLLYGVLRDAADPYGTGLSRRGRRHLAQLGWTLGPVNPAAALLTTHGIDPGPLAARWPPMRDEPAPTGGPPAAGKVGRRRARLRLLVLPG